MHCYQNYIYLACGQYIAKSLQSFDSGRDERLLSDSNDREVVPLLLFKGRRKPKGRPFAFFALDADFATHQFREPLGDREAQTRAAVSSCGRSVGLDKRGEDRRLLIFGHSDSCVADGEANDGRPPMFLV